MPSDNWPVDVVDPTREAGWMQVWGRQRSYGRPDTGKVDTPAADLTWVRSTPLPAYACLTARTTGVMEGYDDMISHKGNKVASRRRANDSSPLLLDFDWSTKRGLPMVDPALKGKGLRLSSRKQARQKMAVACYVSRSLAFLSCLVFFFFLISSFCFFAHATDTLTQGQSLTDGRTLVSAGNIFELRFFSPGNSNQGRYVGILYHPNISATQTVVWVANREAPITGSDGSLMVTNDGDLVVLDGAGGSVWSTNSSATASNNSTTLQLLDTGNLVLQDGGGGTLWQSFDHPTHTFLPGMKVSLNTTTSKALLFTSWKSPDDPSAGNYSMGLDPNGSAQIFIWDRGVPRWRSGQWNGHRFIGTVMRSLYIYGFDYETDESQGTAYYTYTPHNASLVRFVMEWDGMETTFMQVQETRGWETVWGQPVNQCEVYGKCGVYGTCSDDGTTTTCGCLQGFEPRSSAEWGVSNWTGGCVRKTPLDCRLNSSSNENGFFTLPGVKLPDHSDWASTIGSESGCREACLSNCSCRAYAYAASDIGCLSWGHDLIDIYQFEFPQDGYDLHVKLAASDLGKYFRVLRTTNWIVFLLCFKQQDQVEGNSGGGRMCTGVTACHHMLLLVVEVQFKSKR
ncbi:hypothetical protein BHM03_00016998 [Ensete ventricosum]|nr:hypothetical protein BHM03_00016998 [Ensete ventricosum]